MYGIILIVILVLTGGIIAFIGDRLGSKVGKKKLSLFGLRPKHTSTIVTIITGILITTSTFGILAVISKDVRTALFGMDKLKVELASKQEEVNRVIKTLDEKNKSLNDVEQNYKKSKEQLSKITTVLESTQTRLQQAQEAARALRYEQSVLLSRNRELHNFNTALNSNNLALKSENNQLQQGIDNMRENPIIYRVGELLSSGVVEHSTDADDIEAQLAEIIADANKQIANKQGDIAQVVLYPQEYHQVLERLINSKGDNVVRVIVAGNVAKGSPVICTLDVHPNHLVYREHQLIYQKEYNIDSMDNSTQNLISDFLHNVNLEASRQGILPNPLTGTIGIINGNQLYDLELALANVHGDIIVSAFAVNNTNILGPLRMDVLLHQIENPSTSKK